MITLLLMQETAEFLTWVSSHERKEGEKERGNMLLYVGRWGCYQELV